MTKNKYKKMEHRNFTSEIQLELTDTYCSTWSWL